MGQQAAVEASADGVTWTRLITTPGITSIPTEVTVDGATIVLLGTSGWDERPGRLDAELPGFRRDLDLRRAAPDGPGRLRGHDGAGEDGIVAVGRCSGTLAWVAPSGGAAP